jgi:hypothetical protein
MIGKALTVFGICIFLVGLGWFAHFSFSLSSYVSSVVTMGVGVVVGMAGSAPWRDFLFSIRRYFRRR